MSNTLLRVRAFRGLDQSRGDWGGDPAAAAQCVNFICRGGVLETLETLVQSGASMPQLLETSQFSLPEAQKS